MKNKTQSSAPAVLWSQTIAASGRATQVEFSLLATGAVRVRGLLGAGVIFEKERDAGCLADDLSSCCARSRVGVDFDFIGEPSTTITERWAGTIVIELVSALAAAYQKRAGIGFLVEVETVDGWKFLSGIPSKNPRHIDEFVSGNPGLALIFSDRSEAVAVGQKVRVLSGWAGARVRSVDVEAMT